MCAKRVSKELHDAFENDIDLNLSGKSIIEEAELMPTEEVTPGKQRELIERVRPSEIIPDRFQPRPVLPAEIHCRYFAGEINCYQAAAEWLRLAKGDKGHRQRVSELMNMAESVDEHGQIKPITGAWETKEDGSYFFRIETGERRFWGACLKRVAEGDEGEPLLRVEAVASPSVERQIIENRHAQAPTTVAQAREIAALLLKKLNYRPDPDLADPYDHFRMAIDLPGRERLPRGIWDEIEPIMQLTPRRMRQVLSILRMPTPLLEKADRYDLSDRVIQAVLAEPEEGWEDLMQAAIDQSLTGEEMAALAGTSSKEALRKRKSSGRRDYAWSALRGLRGFSGAVERAGEGRRSEVLDAMADEIVVQEDAGKVLSMLEELTGLVRARLRALEEMEGGRQ
jgi:hypothetical protein